MQLGEKYLLTQILKKYKKITCVSGENISDCFALSEADIGVTSMKESKDIVKKTSDILVKDFTMIIDSM
jgi:magnesium-transporting ATPase (P-type)